MFVQFHDADGREVWINPIQVRAVREKRGLLGGVRGSEVWFSYSSMSSSVDLPSAPADVAGKLAAALPAAWWGESTEDDEGSTGQSASQVE
ncbi:MAG TPA: hypothetical protein VD963_02865 [Phycisphaerales bacterium]|nr:hypothetical protein [Phycisphaerales bacterium]